MGPPPGTYYYNSLWALFRASTLHLLRLSQHDPVRLRCCDRLSLPPLLHTQRLSGPAHLSLAHHSRAPDPRLHNQLTSIALRIRVAEAPRLRDVHPSQELQTAPSDAAAHQRIPQAIPSVQIRRRRASHARRRGLHAAPPELDEEGRQGQRERVQRVRAAAAGHQPAVRRAHQLDAGLHLRDLPPLLGPADDVRPEYHEHAADGGLSARLAVRRAHARRRVLRHAGQWRRA